MKSILVLFSILMIPGTVLLPPGEEEVKPPVNSIRTFQEPDVERLVKDFFLKDECSNVSNIRKIGDDRGIGFFDSGAGSIGFSDGIILATGLVSNAQGPNISSERTTGFGEDSLDPDLRALSTGEIFDNVGIEFDFVPQKEFVSFSYVFASEEYCEFVGSIFNDVFGFFVSGPGINGPFDRDAINVALIPETDEFVAINNVNHEKNREFYVKNELLDDANRCGIPFQPSFENEIEYDGFTVRLKAVLRVIPCATYHIRLVVGDVGDDQLDSAVFLESKSFDIGPEIAVNFVSENGASTTDQLKEGCNRGFLVFSRTDLEKLDQDLLVNYDFTPNTNAEEGQDFSTLPDSIIIPANEFNVRIPIEAIADQQTEGSEDVGIEIQSLCNCQQRDNTLFTIKDVTPIELTSNTIEVCPGESANISVDIEAGTAPFQYQWQDGSTNPVLTIDSISNNQDYLLTITDFCGDSLQTTVTTRLQMLPQLELSGTFDWCEGSVVDIPVNFTGSAPWQLEYQLNGRTVLLEDIEAANYFIPVDQPGTLEVSFFSDANCPGMATGQVSIIDEGPGASPVITPPSCPEAQDAGIALNVASTTAYEIRWSQSVNNPDAPSNLAAGTYDFTITDQNNCSYSDRLQIEPPTPEQALENRCPSLSAADNLYIPNAFSPNNDGKNDDFRIYPKSDFVATILNYRIFDRWGNQLFEAKNFQLGDQSIRWDGTYRDRPMSAGVYIYQLEVETAAGRRQILSGNITLIR